jgi:hypothetical protein
LYIGRESGVVIEVKYSDELPHWAVALSGLLSETSSGERASKFVTGAGQLWERRVSSS